MKLQLYYPVGVAGPLARIIEGYVKEWNQSHPQIQVEPVFAGGYTEAYSKTLAAIRGGTPPDVAIMLSQNLNDILGQDIVIPLDELIAADAAEVKIDDFFPAFMLNSRQGGKVWSMPFQRSTPVMYYNKEAFKEAGLDASKPPQTQVELVAAAKKLTKQEGGRVTRWGLLIPSSGGVDTWLLEGLVIDAGGLLYDANNSCCKVLLSSPATEAAVQFLRDLGTKGESQPGGTDQLGHDGERSSPARRR
jgi:sn-glycerol 3-phosphate transport system substrate-binding protein